MRWKVPDLVQPTFDDASILEVKWTWLPFFLAMDAELVKNMDRKLSEEFSGQEPDLVLLNARVIDMCCEAHPTLEGLREALELLTRVSWNDKV